MSQPNEAQNTAPNVQDKRKPAPGVLPKNAQTWVVIGLTTVIIVMLWVSGPTKGAKSVGKADAPKTETVVGLSPAEIGARLEQQRREQQTPLTPSQRPPNEQSERGGFASGGNQEAAVPVEQDPIQQDMRRREYTSRFSSSVSLSYRSQPTSESGRSTADPSAQLPLDLSALEIPNLPVALTNVGMHPAQSAASPIETAHKKSNPNFNQANGKNYVVFEGTVLETVLVTRLNGDFSGPVICMLTNNIYSCAFGKAA